MAFKDLSFKYPWRDYQQTILDELETHIHDAHLHVVAAPGSGKTVLGLETMIRLGKPALILAPTLTIRNQWAERLVDLFVPEGMEKPDWISLDPKAPSKVNIFTYQGLHSALSGDDEDGDVVVDEEGNGNNEETPLELELSPSAGEAVYDLLAAIRAKNIQTLILDEAHHLRKEWWRVLIKLKKEIDVATVVSLTATPPFDVESSEWERYIELCGEIDAEISVPELVAAGDLCPHEDFVFLSEPTEHEKQTIKRFEQDMMQLSKDVSVHQPLIEAVQQLPIYADPDSHIDLITSIPAEYSSLLIFLNSAGLQINPAALRALGVEKKTIPPLNFKWLEEFLNAALYKWADELEALGADIKDLRNHVKRLGGIERRKVVLTDQKHIKKALSSSLSKIGSIETIVRYEAHNMKGELRAVVLSDYIRKPYLPTAPDDYPTIDKMGVIPIFETLRRAEIPDIKLGILTGSLIILPASAVDTLNKVAERNAIQKSHLNFEPCGFSPDYVIVKIKGASKHRMVHMITETFEEGAVTVLVGTQALLGEGWDAPCLNTLVLASFVGSYMLSNQMRGRAIRVDPANPEKVANVWHLAAIYPRKIAPAYINNIQELLKLPTVNNPFYDPMESPQSKFGDDLITLSRRFRAFEGTTFSEPYVIENGVGRLGLGDLLKKGKSASACNEAIMGVAMDRRKIAHRWKVAQQGASERPEMIEKVRTIYSPQTLVFSNTIMWLVAEALLFVVIAVSPSLEAGTRAGAYAIGLTALGAFLYVSPKLFKALVITLRHGSLEGSVKQVGHAVADTLVDMGEIKTNPKALKVIAKRSMGVVHCTLKGCDRLERAKFVETLEQVLNPVDNPRYLIYRPSKLGFILRNDFHPVPRNVGRLKKNADQFERHWRRRVGVGHLVYTRTPEGRRVLLKARAMAMANRFVKRADRKTIWE